MTLYLDTSLIVPLFVPDRFNERAEVVLRDWRSAVVVSDFAAAEFASAIARRVRAGEIAVKDARIAFGQFDAWSGAAAQPARVQPSDIAAATVLVRRLDLPIRTADAIHVAIAQRHGATLATFDQQMARSAEALAVPVAGG